ncbi:hypothetical protein V6N11_014978 [Hibiscus sabdariffa]|uniref:Uncharacterized protein n=1 Tax=Hibiscus sabdariffa TaxID=183260 RepID=A0ABR2TR79_9ROSI
MRECNENRNSLQSNGWAKYVERVDAPIPCIGSNLTFLYIQYSESNRIEPQNEPKINLHNLINVKRNRMHETAAPSTSLPPASDCGELRGFLKLYGAWYLPPCCILKYKLPVSY